MTQKILQSDPGRSATSLQTFIAANLRYYMATLSLHFNKFKKIMFDINDYCAYNKYMDRREAQTNIIALLKRIDGRTSPWTSDYTFSYAINDNVHSRDLYIDEINSFPCIMVTVDRVQVSHIGANTRYHTLAFRIRGITWDGDAQSAGEALADDIEHALEHARQEHPTFDEVRIDSIQTDEGINAPLGAVLIQGIAVYQNE